MSAFFTSRRFVYPMLFLVALAAFTVGLAGHEILMIDTRFALFCHEYIEGAHGFFPRLYGNLYPDYPVLPVALSALGARLCGGVNYLGIVLPSAIAGALLVALTCAIGDRMRGLRFGVTAALLLFGAFEFVSIGRIVSLDLYVALAAALAFYVCLAAEETKFGTLWRLPVLTVLAAAGFVTRGPIGFVIVAAVIFAYDTVKRRWPRALVTGTVLAAALAGMVALAVRLALNAGGPDFVEAFWQLQVVGRMSSTKPFWYYFTNAAGSFAFTYPLGLLTLICFAAVYRKRVFSAPELEFVRLLGGWLLIVVLGMSIPGTKHLRYITPVLPPAALLAAEALTGDFEFKPFAMIRRYFTLLVTWLPAAAAIGIGVAFFILRIDAVGERIGGTVTLPLLQIAGVLLAAEALVLISRRSREVCRLPFLVGAAVLLVWCARVYVAEEIDQATLSSREFVTACEKWRPEGERIVFFELGPDGDENKYMALVDRSRMFVPRYLVEAREWLDPYQQVTLDFTTYADLMKLPSGIWLVARSDKLAKLLPEEFLNRCEFITEGKLSRRRCVLCRLK